MLSKTKKDRRNAQLKQFILQSGTVTRAEVVEHLDLDIRTATAYLEKLCCQGFCRQENGTPDGKGRPGIVYSANSDNMVFAGVLISQKMTMDCVLSTIDGNILEKKMWEYSSRQSKLTLFNSILDMIRDVTDSYPDKILGGIGVAVSRWLQPPLAAYDLYSGLIKFLEKETGVMVYRTLNINALAYDAANTYSCKDITVFHTGNVIELGIIQNGRNILNYQEHESALAHLRVNKNGPRCYCGKKGCLENYVTNGALQEKISSISPGASVDELASDPKLKKLKNEVVDYLVQSCRYLDQTYKPERILLMTNKNIAESTVRESAKEKLDCEVNYLNPKDYSVVKGAALMAAFMAVKQYK
jgi:predicted NBD/HSP70 family sugar kinase